jgi:hypothetical protein
MQKRSGDGEKHAQFAGPHAAAGELIHFNDKIKSAVAIR